MTKFTRRETLKYATAAGAVTIFGLGPGSISLRFRAEDCVILPRETG